MITIFFLFNILFIAYFIIVKFYRGAIIPLVFSLLILYIAGDELINQQTKKINFKTILLNNLLLIGYLLINTGIYLSIKYVSKYFLFTNLYPSILLLGINLLIFIISNLINIYQRKTITHITIYLIESFLILKLFQQNENIITGLFLLTILNFTIYTFLVFIVGNFRKIENNIKGLWFLFLNLVILILLYRLQLFNLEDTLFILQIYLFILFALLGIIKYSYHYLTNSIKEENKHKEDNILKEILIGKHPFLPKPKKKNIKKTLLSIVEKIYNFINDLPDYIKILLGLINVTIILLQIYVFIKNLGTFNNILITEILYWSSILIFIFNFFILKYLNFYHTIQRLFIVFIINFGIYLSILNIFGKNFTYISILGILRNLINSLAIFGSSKFIKNKILTYDDIFLRIIANIIAIPINIFFLFKTPLIYDLKLAILGIYIGSQFILIFYNFKYLEKLKSGK